MISRKMRRDLSSQLAGLKGDFYNIMAEEILEEFDSFARPFSPGLYEVSEVEGLDYDNERTLLKGWCEREYEGLIKIKEVAAPQSMEEKIKKVKEKMALLGARALQMQAVRGDGILREIEEKKKIFRESKQYAGILEVVSQCVDVKRLETRGLDRESVDAIVFCFFVRYFPGYKLDNGMSSSEYIRFIKDVGSGYFLCIEFDSASAAMALERGSLVINMYPSLISSEAGPQVGIKEYESVELSPCVCFWGDHFGGLTNPIFPVPLYGVINGGDGKEQLLSDFLYFLWRLSRLAPSIMTLLSKGVVETLKQQRE